MPQPQDRKRLYFFVGCLYFLAVILAVRAAFELESGPTDLLIRLMVPLMMARTCAVDARLMGKPIHLLRQWHILLAWPVALPICLVRSRGWRGLGLLVVHSIAVLVVIAIVLLARVTWIHLAHGKVTL